MECFVRPATTTLTLTSGHTLTVKTQLTWGERNTMRARMYTVTNGERVFDPGRVMPALLTAYLVDWSLTDALGNRASIYLESLSNLEAIIDKLQPELGDEIYGAIETHERDQAAAREQEKKRSAATSGNPISPLPSAAAGELIGSAR